MKVVAIIQARMSSTRLPGKMLLPLAGAPLIQRVLERVQRATTIATVVLAVPLNDWAAFSPYCHSPVKFYAHPGDEHDLVGRYLAAAQDYDADLIVRIPGDNPCVEPAYIDAIVRIWHRDLTPFCTNTTAYCDGVKIDGIGAEVFSYNRLQWLDDCTQGNPDLREHIHKSFCATLPMADIRLDVNTQSEYDYIKAIYDHCYPSNPHFTIHDILTFLQEAGYAVEKRVEQESH